MDPRPPRAAKPDPRAAADAVRHEARAAGFRLVGIAPADPPPRADRLDDFLAQGRHGEMHYLADHAELRKDPRKLLPGARSVICVAEPYADAFPAAPPPDAQAAQEAAAPDAAPATPTGRVARYAWGDDYHRVMKKALHRLCDNLAAQFPGERFRAAVDTAPVMERPLAEAAGLGWTGKHTLTIHPRHGSWLLLGVVLTTLKLETADEAGYPAPTVPPTDHCGTCTRCLDACPTNCIEPYALDAARCISYLTLEHRSTIDPVLHGPMGNWIAGCDVCQEVCPHNRAPHREVLPVHDALSPRPGGPGPTMDLLSVLRFTEDDRRRAFARSALKRIKLPMLKRNALIAAGNALAQRDDQALLAAVRDRAADPAEAPVVRQTAQQVLDRLGARAAQGDAGGATSSSARATPG